jgi:hypothetical protein
MKNESLTGTLIGVLALGALASVVLCLFYISDTRELRSLSTQAVFINNRRAAVTALANEALEYSKKNPSIDPILQTAGLKPGGQPAPASAIKPATK